MKQPDLSQTSASEIDRQAILRRNREKIEMVSKTIYIHCRNCRKVVGLARDERLSYPRLCLSCATQVSQKVKSNLQIESESFRKETRFLLTVFGLMVLGALIIGFGVVMIHNNFNETKPWQIALIIGVLILILEFIHLYRKNEN